MRSIFMYPERLWFIILYNDTIVWLAICMKFNFSLIGFTLSTKLTHIHRSESVNQILIISTPKSDHKKYIIVNFPTDKTFYLCVILISINLWMKKIREGRISSLPAIASNPAQPPSLMKRALVILYGHFGVGNTGWSGRLCGMLFNQFQ